MRASENIDAQGYRSNVGIIIANDRGQVLWARRVGGHDAWQFPQGGIQRSESPETALYRELYEEVGVQRGSVEILASTRGWLRYRLPKRYLRNNGRGARASRFVGQKQKWFLLRLLGDDSLVDLDCSSKPEFDSWQWVSYWYPLTQVINFKRNVYRRALREFAPSLIVVEQS